MKKSIIIFFLVFFSVSTSFAASKQKACEKYKNKSSEEYSLYCSNIGLCDSKYSPTSESQNILKIDQIPFLPVLTGTSVTNASDGEYSAIYTDYLSKLLGDSGGTPNIGAKPAEQAKAIYIETQNAVYNCAVLEAKIKIGEKILELMSSDEDSNIIAKIKKINEDLNTEIGKKNCNKPGDKNTAYRTILLKNITYHYCNYRHYLNYLSSFPENNVLSNTISSKVQRPGEDKMTSVNMAKFAGNQMINMKKEMAHERQVYLMSMSTFSEFENTYGPHILLTLIYDDYTSIKKNLAKLLNPISQLAYKMPQAQKQ